MEIGIVGYSAQSFDQEKAREILSRTLAPYSGRDDVIVSSRLTNLGVPAIAYEVAQRYELKTKGVACAKAKEYDCFPCDIVAIHGENWGDESAIFLGQLDMLVRVGGGKQSFAEVEIAKSAGVECIEFEL